MTIKELLERYASGHRDFGNINLSESNLSRITLSHANLSHAILSIANLSGATLVGSNLSYAQLNVARLSGTNLAQANLEGAILNVSNMIRANLSEANLERASLVRAEMIRALLTNANLTSADLNTADLRECNLNGAMLVDANLSEADLRSSAILGANLTGANLTSCDLSKSDLTGSDLTRCELRHVRLHRANLSGVCLRGANLRWADLSGADLRWADLSEAKLSGANLIGADLSHANLLKTSFVHADLTQANLIRSDWEGADLSGATLTGAKLFGVSRFNLRTQGMTCEWVDMSPNGDHSKLYRFTPDNFQKFFNQTPPLVKVEVDYPLDHEANLAIAQIYHAIAAQAKDDGITPPSIEADYRRTVLNFRVESDEQLFPTLFMATLPFQDAEPIQRAISSSIRLMQAKSGELLGVKEANQAAKLSVTLIQRLRRIGTLQAQVAPLIAQMSTKFLHAPLQATLTNSSDHTLRLYSNPRFGKRFLNASDLELPQNVQPHTPEETSQPGAADILTFVQGFYSLEEVS